MDNPFPSAVTGESVADRELDRFKKNPGNRGQTCRAGLWRYSRHPNYFFEWLIWIGFALVALPARNYGWVGFLSPALILFFLLRVSGIPATEAQALRTKGDDYRDYQRTTSAFGPPGKRGLPIRIGIQRRERVARLALPYGKEIG